ncbi:MAG: hypothetical protein F6J90_26960 [Moorea sp. SIOASIH]|uniref:hypothetical protein n=1 Tax=Moorena sp. SIOASIH TaxID=2607817 RepID=UPI0013B8546B|nr:hypothetical protein [Moorena sp. SIOASIH]NEO39773.1 hypothetical protein [Moorena sp. SIOASIH]
MSNHQTPITVNRTIDKSDARQIDPITSGATRVEFNSPRVAPVEDIWLKAKNLLKNFGINYGHFR